MPARTRASTKRKRIKSSVKDKDGSTLTTDTQSPVVKRSRTRTKLNAPRHSLQKIRYSAHNENDIPIEERLENDAFEQSDQLLSRLLPVDPRVEDVVAALMEKRKIVRYIGTRPLSQLSGNLVHFTQNLQFGTRAPQKLRQSVPDTVASQISQLQLFRTASPFERRSTAIEWHPTNPNLVAVGSKFGEVILWDFHNINNDIFIPGTGPDGSIQAMKFLPDDSTRIITASINGTVSIHTLGKHQKEIFMDTHNSYDDWYCSLDVHRERNVAAVGDNHGNITLKTIKDGKKTFESRLHRNKVTHLEFSPREEWLLASASTDHTVQLWDIRMVQDRKSSLAVLTHDKPINSVYFSQCNSTRLLTTDQHSDLRVYTAPYFNLSLTIPHPHRHFRHITPIKTSGTRLLTTDQKSEIRVYSAPDYSLTLTLQHPHRQFQHLTPIKASWHPLSDLIVVGRYPDEKFPGYSPGELRTIDLFCADTGKLMCQLYDSQAKGIISLNKFSPNGEYLASGMGVNILMWSMRHDLEEKQSSLIAAIKQTGLTPGGSSRNRSQAGKLTKSKKEAEKTAQAKLKLKTKTTTKKR